MDLINFKVVIIKIKILQIRIVHQELVTIMDSQVKIFDILNFILSI